jgi:hypothetical protein
VAFSEFHPPGPWLIYAVEIDEPVAGDCGGGVAGALAHLPEEPGLAVAELGEKFGFAGDGVVGGAEEREPVVSGCALGEGLGLLVERYFGIALGGWRGDGF